MGKQLGLSGKVVPTVWEAFLREASNSNESAKADEKIASVIGPALLFKNAYDSPHHSPVL